MFVSNSHMSRLLCIQDSYPIEDLFITDWSETIVNVSHVEGNSALCCIYPRWQHEETEIIIYIYNNLHRT